MRDIITLRGLRAFGIHGVYDFEQTQSQPFVVDIALWVDISQATSSDDLEQTVSYADVARDVVAIVTGPSVKLIETLAERIATALMDYPLVDGVQVVVHKPQAPLEQEFSDVSVSVTRGVTHSSGAERVIALEDPASNEVTATDSAERRDVPEAVITPVFPFPSRRDYAASRVAPPTLAPSPTVTEDEADAADLDTPVATGLPDASAQAEAPEPAPVDGSSPAAQTSEEPGEPSWVEFVLAFGGNQGNVPVTLAAALDVLDRIPGVEIHTVSPLFRTHAVLKPGMDPQDDHWNMVALGRTTFDPHELLAITADLEGVLGRRRPFEWAPRTIDIDLITVGDRMINDEVLQLPHPRAHMRGFVLIPWLLVDPLAELPGYGSVAELAAQAADRDGIVDIVDHWQDKPESVIADSDLLLACENTPISATSDVPAPVEDAPQDQNTPEMEDASPQTLDEAPAAEQAEPSQAVLSETRIKKAPRPRGRNFAAEWESFVKDVDLQPLSASEPQPAEEAPAPVEDVSEAPSAEGVDEDVALVSMDPPILVSEHSFTPAPADTPATPEAVLAPATAESTTHLDTVEPVASPESVFAPAPVPSPEAAVSPAAAAAPEKPATPARRVAAPPLASRAAAWSPTVKLPAEPKPAEARLADTPADNTAPTLVPAFLSAPDHGLKVLKPVEDADRSASEPAPVDPWEDAPTVYQPIPTPAASAAPFAPPASTDEQVEAKAEAPARRSIRHKRHSAAQAQTQSASASESTPWGSTASRDAEPAASLDLPLGDAEQRFAKPSFDEALQRERRADTQVSVSWIPVNARRSQAATQDAGPLADTKDAEDAPRLEDRPLPKWNFANTPVNVIDSIDEVDIPASTVQVDDTPSGQIMLDPDLPEDIEVGILPPSEEMPTTVSRRNVLRPTHTGATPVVKRPE